MGKLLLWHINRDKALEAKDDVTELLEDLDSKKSSFPDLEGKLQDSMDLIQNLNKDLTQVGRLNSQFNIHSSIEEKRPLTV